MAAEDLQARAAAIADRARARRLGPVEARLTEIEQALATGVERYLAHPSQLSGRRWWRNPYLTREVTPKRAATLRRAATRLASAVGREQEHRAA